MGYQFGSKVILHLILLTKIREMKNEFLPGKSGFVSGLAVLFLLLFTPGSSFAYQGDEHPEDSTEQHAATQKPGTASTGHESSDEVMADFEDFPNLHPLVVHVPIMMLPLAALLQLIGFFVFKREISWIVLGIVVFGFIGAYAASNWTHPHVTGLPSDIQKVYDAHDTYASWTLWLSGIAVLLKVGSHFFLDRAVWAEGVVVLVLLASTYTVSIAGHYGSQLVYVEGVGPQGDYLETGEHEH